MKDKSKNAVLRVFSSDAEAHIVQGFLAEHGIPAILENETFSSVLPITFNSIGGIRMLVRESDLAEAERLLAETGDN